MNTSETELSLVDSLKASRLRGKAKIFLVLPWPLLYFGYWSLYHVKGPASDGFGMGMYSAGILATAYGLALYFINRAVVYSKHIPESRRGDRALYIVALILFIAGVLGLLPMIFILFVGFPFSLVGIIFSVLALFRWHFPAETVNRSKDGV